MLLFDFRLDMLTVPTPGSMHFVKHLITKDQKPAGTV